LPDPQNRLLPKQESPGPVQSNGELNDKSHESDIYREIAPGAKVRTGLDEAGREQPRGKRVRNARAIRDQCHDQESAEYGQTFNAIGVGASKALHERREVGIVRLELVSGNVSPCHKSATKDFHKNDKKQRPCDQ
jgi:hypothetical protein